MVAGGQTQTFNPNDPVVRHMLQVRAEHAQQQEKNYSHVFRPKSLFDLIRLSCIILGIELTYAAETAFVSPILLQIGVEHQHMTMVWSLAPLLGFFFAPLLGSISDRCRMRMGRRRPLIIALCLGLLFGLIFIPYGRDIGVLFGDSQVNFDPLVNFPNMTDDNVTSLLPAMRSSKPTNSYIYSIIFIILGAILIDFNVNTAQTPCRAYILDVSIPTDHARALSSFTVMAGLGGTMGYALGGINWESTSIGSFFGGNVETVFAIVTFCFVICFVITTTSFREIPLSLIEKDELLRPLSAAAIKKELQKNGRGRSIPEALHLEPVNSPLESQLALAKEDFSITGSFQNVSEKQLESGNTEAEEEQPVSLREYMVSVFKMPKAMRILCLTNLLCWMADLCYCLYFTDFVGEAVFNGDPTAPKNSEKAILYEEGIRFGCWGLSIYAFSCAIYSSVIESLMKVLSTKIVYTGGILIFGIGMAILAAWPTKPGVLVFSAAAGVIYATMFIMPYIMVARYHSQGCFKVKDGENVEMKQHRGLGTDIAIVSSMAFVAQLIISLGIGSIISLTQSTSAVLYTASVLSVAASLCALKVLYLE